MPGRLLAARGGRPVAAVGDSDERVGERGARVGCLRAVR